MAVSTDSTDSQQSTGGDTPSFVRENLKRNLMGKSFDELIHDQSSVDSLIGGVAHEFVEVDQDAL